MDINLLEFSRTLGSILAKLETIERDIASMQADQKEFDQKSQMSRATMHQRLDEVVKRTGKLEGDFESMSEIVKDMKQVTDDVKMWKQRGIGFIAFAGIAGTALGGSVVYYIQTIMDYIRTPH